MHCEACRCKKFNDIAGGYFRNFDSTPNSCVYIVIIAWVGAPQIPSCLASRNAVRHMNDTVVDNTSTGYHESVSLLQRCRSKTMVGSWSILTLSMSTESSVAQGLATGGMTIPWCCRAAYDGRCPIRSVWAKRGGVLLVIQESFKYQSPICCVAATSVPGTTTHLLSLLGCWWTVIWQITFFCVMRIVRDALVEVMLEGYVRGYKYLSLRTRYLDQSSKIAPNQSDFEVPSDIVHVDLSNNRSKTENEKLVMHIYFWWPVLLSWD
jgi:hypothetical protein